MSCYLKDYSQGENLLDNESEGNRTVEQRPAFVMKNSVLHYLNSNRIHRKIV